MKRSRSTQQAFASLDNIHHQSRLKALDWDRITIIIIIKQVSTNHVKLSSKNEKKKKKSVLGEFT